MLGLLAIVIVAFVAAAVLLPHSPSGLRELMLRIGPLAPAVAFAAWILLVPAMFPATLLAAASGLAFGTLDGSALAFSGAIAGGLVAFALARISARGPVEGFVERTPRLARVHELLEAHGFAGILAARLMPGVPASGLHYAAGVSPVRPRAFTAAITVGALLRTVPYAVLGQGLGTGSLPTILVAVASIALGGLAAALLVRRIRQPVAAA